MKRIYSWWADYIQYPAAQADVVVVIILTVFQASCFGMYHQMTGTVPVSLGISLPFAHWQLPFPVSRLWDLLIGPFFILVSGVVLNCSWFLDEDDYGVTNWLGTLIVLAVEVASVVGLISGIVYVIPVAVEVFVVLFFGTIVGGLVWSICHTIVTGDRGGPHS